jgi:uncharacterized protein (TIGR02646 family)
MMRLSRPDAPSMLRDHAEEWTRSWIERRARSAGAEFRWPVLEGKSVHPRLLRDLLEMSAHHCAYCDTFELGEGSRETIDHFRPKGRFPRLAFAWENLFPACDRCQQAKGERFDDRLLKPDAPDYGFDRFFIFNFRSGEIETNPAAPPADQDRARFTIDALGLNRDPRPRARRRCFDTEYAPARGSSGKSIDTMPYRFLAPVPAVPRPPCSGGGEE